jgi:hypothetical protein
MITASTNLMITSSFHTCCTLRFPTLQNTPLPPSSVLLGLIFLLRRFAARGLLEARASLVK